MDKELFEVMVNDWIADHADEVEDLVIGDVRYDDDMGCLVADAEDTQSIYLLSSQDGGNIRMDYAGLK